MTFTASCRAIAAILLLLGCIPILHARDGADARYHRPFVLYGKEKKDPYTVFIPIQLTRPGLIRVSTRIIPEPGIEKRNLRVQIMDVGMFDRKKTPPDFWEQLRRASQPVKDVANTAIELSPILSAIEWFVEDYVSALRYIARVWKKDSKKSIPAYYHGGIIIEHQLTDGLEHAVDQPELTRTGGRYVIVLDNFATDPVQGDIRIDYPGDEWNVARDIEEGYALKPDLAVESVSLDATNRLVVQIASVGKAPIPAARWHDPLERQVSLSIRLDGRTRANIPLTTFDPEKLLAREGRQFVRYITDIVIDRAVNVEVRLDPDKRLIESNTRNNNLREDLAPGEQRRRHQHSGEEDTKGPLTLQPGPAGSAGRLNPATPDLAITNLWLDDWKRINIEVRNTGGPLPEDIWARPGSDQPSVRVYQDGRSWIFSNLSVIDPNRSLARPGGAVTYAFPERLRVTANLTVTIDAEGSFADADRSNNSLTRHLQP